MNQFEGRYYTAVFKCFVTSTTDKRSYKTWANLEVRFKVVSIGPIYTKILIIRSDDHKCYKPGALYKKRTGSLYLALKRQGITK